MSDLQTTAESAEAQTGPKTETPSGRAPSALSASEEANLRRANKMKRAFMGTYFPAIMVMGAHAGVNLFAAPSSIAWWGPIAVLVGAMGALSYIMAPWTARTSRNMPASIALAFAGPLLAVLGLVAQEGTSALPFVYTIVGAAGWLAYVAWYSKIGGTEHSRIKVGTPLPDFTLATADGQPVASATLRGKPLMLMFYRGNWCPLCTAQIAEIAGQYREFEARGARVVFVSPQPEKHTNRIAAKFDIPVEFLRDPGEKAARQLGLLHVDGIPPGMGALGYDSDTVFPTIVITDAEGTVKFVEVSDNYRVRPEPGQYLKYLGAGA